MSKQHLPVASHASFDPKTSGTECPNQVPGNCRISLSWGEESQGSSGVMFVQQELLAESWHRAENKSLDSHRLCSLAQHGFLCLLQKRELEAMSFPVLASWGFMMTLSRWSLPSRLLQFLHMAIGILIKIKVAQNVTLATFQVLSSHVGLEAQRKRHGNRIGRTWLLSNKKQGPVVEMFRSRPEGHPGDTETQPFCRHFFRWGSVRR